MKKLVVILMASIFSVLCFAGSGTGEFKVNQVRVENGVTYIFPKTAIENGEECDSSSSIILNVNAIGYDQIFSIALAAAASGKNMQCWVSSCTGSPWGSTRPVIYACEYMAE